MSIVIVFIVVICILVLCTSHWNTNRRLVHQRSILQAQIRRATEYSVAASNTINPVLALVDVLKAQQTIYVLQSVYGKGELYALTCMDTARMQDIIEQQRIKVTKDILEVFPAFTPKHPLLPDTMFTPEFSQEDEMV